MRDATIHYQGTIFRNGSNFVNTVCNTKSRSGNTYILIDRMTLKEWKRAWDKKQVENSIKTPKTPGTPTLRLKFPKTQEHSKTDSNQQKPQNIPEHLLKKSDESSTDLLKKSDESSADSGKVYSPEIVTPGSPSQIQPHMIHHPISISQMPPSLVQQEPIGPPFDPNNPLNGYSPIITNPLISPNGQFVWMFSASGIPTLVPVPSNFNMQKKDKTIMVTEEEAKIIEKIREVNVEVKNCVKRILNCT